MAHLWLDLTPEANLTLKSLAIGALACAAVAGVSTQVQAQTAAPMVPALSGVYVGGSADTNSALYGVGARYHINPNLAVRAEYTRLASDTGTFGVGVQYSF